MVRAFEAVRGHEYAWLVRLRSDFKAAPPLHAWPHSSQWTAFDRRSIFLLGLTGWSRTDARWVPCKLQTSPCIYVYTPRAHASSDHTHTRMHANAPRKQLRLDMHARTTLPYSSVPAPCALRQSTGLQWCRDASAIASFLLATATCVVSTGSSTSSSALGRCRGIGRHLNVS